MANRLSRSQRQKIIRDLAVAAQEALYHDVDETMPEYQNGVATLERVFSKILRGKLSTPAGRLALEQEEGK